MKEPYSRHARKSVQIMPLQPETGKQRLAWRCRPANEGSPQCFVRLSTIWTFAWMPALCSRSSPNANCRKLFLAGPTGSLRARRSTSAA
jgi:hypothetical protein